MTVCQIHAILLSVLIATNRIQAQQQNGFQQHGNAEVPLKTQLMPETELQASFGAGIAGYLLAEATDQKLNYSNSIDSTLASVLDRNGPDMRPLRDFRDFDDITLEVAKRAWILMHHHAQTAVADRITFARPLIAQALMTANVSSQCTDAAVQTMEAAQRFDSWAIQPWGNFPPTGVYEGTFGDIGSFHGCVNVPKNGIIDHAHYCTISYRPVMPSRKKYELIVRKEPEGLLGLFHRLGRSTPANNLGQTFGLNASNARLDERNNSNEDAFTDLLDNAQYNHYVYYKFGTCFPIQCTPRDVQKLAKLLGKRSILMTGPVKCHSKYEQDYELSANGTSLGLQISTRDLNHGVYIWKPHMTRAQWISLFIIGLISLIIVLLTLVDIVLNRAPELYRQFIKSQQRRNGQKQYTAANEPKISAGSIIQSVGTGFLDGPIHDHNINMDLYERGTIQSLSLAHYVNGGCLPKETEHGTDTSKTIPLNEDEATSCKRQRCKLRQENRVEEIRDEEDCDYDDEEDEDEDEDGGARADGAKDKQTKQKQRSLFMDIVDDYSIVTNSKQFFRVSRNQLKNDILCINGIRCITMSWIIITHTMQYNDWSAFARTREIETHLKSLINQPLFNGSYLVDTFFLMSGLLTSFSSFKSKSKRIITTHNNDNHNHNYNSTNGTDQLLAEFSSCSYLIGRYLRLTPQILFVSLLFILLPQLSRSGGPHWYTITGEYSENCSQNWWVNLFHIQAFYRSNEMCNFVCWWISVDMFYHLFALAVILLILYYGHRLALLSCTILVLAYGLIQVTKHYQLALPPNLLSTVPQTGAMWSEMTLEFFWTPYAHSFPFFLGFYLGYLMAQRHSKLAAWFTPKRAFWGWTLATCLLFTTSYSTYFWVIGRWQYTRLVAAVFYLVCPIIWASCLAWIIVACHYGYGSWINQMLSCKLFIVLGKASFVVYLSHFLVLFTFFGSQNLLLEPTQLVMSYVIVGNICLSMLLGSLLCVVFEMPWLKTQKRIMKYVC